MNRNHRIGKINLVLLGAFSLLLALPVAQGQLIVSENFENGTLGSLEGTIFSGQQLSGTFNAVRDQSYQRYIDADLPFGTPKKFLVFFDNTGTRQMATTTSWSGGSALSHVSLELFLINNPGAVGSLVLRFYTDSPTSSDRVAQVDFSAQTGLINETTAFTLDEKLSVELFINNTTDTVSYNNPYQSGAVLALDSGHYDLFINGVAVLVNTDYGSVPKAGNGEAIGAFDFYSGMESIGVNALIGHFEVQSFSPIPEPRKAAMVFVGVCLVSILALRRRSKRRSLSAY